MGRRNPDSNLHCNIFQDPCTDTGDHSKKIYIYYQVIVINYYTGIEPGRFRYFL